MRKGKRKRSKRLACLLLSTVLILSGIPVQASEFSSPPEELTDVFSSGTEMDSYWEGSAAVVSSPTPTPADSADGNVSVTPTPSVSVTPSATPSVTPSVTPGASATPIPSVTPSVTPSPSPEPTRVPSPSIDPEKEVLVKFVDGEGNECVSLARIVSWEQSITLPHVPDSTAQDVWKLDQEKSLENSITVEGGETLTLKKGENWGDYIEDGTLTFYMPRKCTVRLYNNSGTAVFAGGTLTAYEGQAVTLKDMPKSGYINYGWTDVRGSATVKYELDSSYTVTEDRDLYIIRRYSLNVTFRYMDGKTSSAFNALGQTIGKGLSIVLPEVPEYTGYEGLGWTLKKNSTTVMYKAGQRVTITADTTFYGIRKKLPYTVTFNNNSGTSTSKVYASMKMYASKNQTITLPEVPKASGYQNIGWTTVKGASSPVYTAGSKVKITKNTRFYTVRRKSKTYTVQFMRGDGKTSSSYKKLTMKVEEGTTITLPQIPARTGYLNVGWSGKKNSTTYNSKNTWTVTKNFTFYSVQKKAATIVLHQYSGAVYSSTTLAEGSTYKLPNIANAYGYTFMGWSTKAMQTTDPEYEAEDRITAKGTIHLYAVVYNRSLEQDLRAGELPQVNIYKYKQVIFVGDSRTTYMQNALNALGSNVTNNIKFISQPGKGLSWFQTEGYSQLYNLIKNGSNSILEKKTAVIFNLGVNDLSNYKKYTAYYNAIAKTLEEHGCELYVMSVNPINRKMLEKEGKTDRSEAYLRNFNTYMQENLYADYTYIDTYSYLKQTGYSFSSDTYGAEASDDGLHYTAKTYKRIFAKAMNSLKGH